MERVQDDFRVGDKAICVTSKGLLLKTGEIYTIRNISGVLVYLKEHPGSGLGFYKGRFKKITYISVARSKEPKYRRISIGG